jgi:Flp pilus assembly protein TadG
MRAALQRLMREEGGGAAVEYALVLPAFITLIVGALCAGQLAFAVNSLHYAVQDAARCAAVRTGVCDTSAHIVTYAQGRYAGPDISPAFSYSTGGCGHTVTASASYPIILAATTIDVPLAAAACYP